MQDAYVCTSTANLSHTKIVRANANCLRYGTPLPSSATVCGLSAASSVNVTAPVSVPNCVGVKTTLIVHEAPACRTAGQVFVCKKSPVLAMLVIFRSPLPLLVSVTVTGALLEPTLVSGKLIEVGVSVASGTATPFPLNETDC